MWTLPEFFVSAHVSRSGVLPFSSHLLRPLFNLVISYGILNTLLSLVSFHDTSSSLLPDDGPLFVAPVFEWGQLLCVRIYWPSFSLTESDLVWCQSTVGWSGLDIVQRWLDRSVWSWLRLLLPLFLPPAVKLVGILAAFHQVTLYLLSENLLEAIESIDRFLRGCEQFESLMLLPWSRFFTLPHDTFSDGALTNERFTCDNWLLEILSTSHLGE